VNLIHKQVTSDANTHTPFNSFN